MLANCTCFSGRRRMSLEGVVPCLIFGGREAWMGLDGGAAWAGEPVQ